MNTLKYQTSIAFSFLIMLLFACSAKGEYQPRTHVVEISNMEFQPAEIRVHAGDSVVWINKDIVAHDVTEESKNWASPVLASGDSWQKVIQSNTSYYCSIHAVMKGSVVVE